MLKVVLQYTDCLQDGRNVFRVLASNKVEILKTKTGSSIYPKITICIDDYNKLNNILYDLSYACNYEVRVVKVKKLENKIKVLRGEL